MSVVATGTYMLAAALVAAGKAYIQWQTDQSPLGAWWIRDKYFYIHDGPQL